MKTVNRVLLTENLKAIDQANFSAKERAAKLNTISPIFEFESEEEFNSRTANIEKLVRSAMMARPELKKLSETVEISAIKIPAEIILAKQKLISMIQTHDDLFANISHDGHSWVADDDKLEKFAESCRVFATGEKQIKRLEAATSLCEFLNDGYGTSVHTKHLFHNQMLDWKIDPTDSAKGKWVANINWITSQ